MTHDSSEALIALLHRAHCDNARLQYYAERPDGDRISIMPVTPFVYEFFLFNSLYDVDWENTGTGPLVFHAETLDEAKKQRAFLSFLRKHAKHRPADIFRAFEPLLDVEVEDGSWTQVTPDARISAADGDAFFRRVREIRGLLAAADPPSAMPTTGRVFDLLRECTHFVYLVRNNVFHGSKTLGEIYEAKQKRRIEVYDLFLKGLTSLFFLAAGKDTAACDFVPCPLTERTLPGAAREVVLDRAAILHAIAARVMRIGDSRLVTRFTKVFPPPPATARPGERSALFYPSAGTDLVTPILLSLPYCTQFHFFERHRVDRRPPPIAGLLEQIPGVQLSRVSPRWTPRGHRECLEFEFNDVPRRVHWVHADNLAFLDEPVDLRFYFHRGDSEGEGGSGQRWDSELLPALRRMIPTGQACLYLTDGEPGGLDTQPVDVCHVLNMPFIERYRTYQAGTIHRDG